MIVFSPFGPNAKKTLIDSYQRELNRLGFVKADEEKAFGDLARPWIKLLSQSDPSLLIKVQLKSSGAHIVGLWVDGVEARAQAFRGFDDLQRAIAMFEALCGDTHETAA